MDKAINSLNRVLDLEIKQGYQDKAVIGGIRQFAAFWVGQAREQAITEADKALVEQVAESLMGYSRLPGVEARAETIDTLKEKIRWRDEHKRSVEDSKPEPPDKPVQQEQPEQEDEQPEQEEEQPEQEEEQPEQEEDKPEEEDAAESEQEDFEDVVAADSEDEAEISQPLPIEIESSAEAEDEDEDEDEAPEPIDVFDTPVIDEEEPQSEIYSQSDSESGQPDPEGLNQPVTVLRGVGQKTAEQLARLGVSTILDLLYVFPHRYDDYTLLKPNGQLSYDETVTVIGTVWETRLRRMRGKQLVQSVISDGTGSVEATWFNQPWLAEKIAAGSQIVLSGKVDQFLGKPVFQNPDWEPLAMEPLRTRRIVPIYPLTKGLAAHRMREIMKQASDIWASKLPEPLPESIRLRRNLYKLPFAVRQAHFPESQESMHKARRRLVFDELFLFQLGMLGLRREWQEAPGLNIPTDLEALKDFIRTLPFQLTTAQKKVIGEIAADVAESLPMNRLLQGDVGSGKTVIAAATMVSVVRAGFQAALMAPTEILAEQHYRGLSKMLGDLDISVCLLTGSTSSEEKQKIYSDLVEGSVDVVIGTHALIQEGVRFKGLGLAVIDEQHRFGVDQRKALREKGIASPTGSKQPNPHLLVMSATPIPRTLALSIYGDLDLSILDELPPGRQDIITYWLQPRERERAYSFVESQVKEGRQAFIICPLVEESDKIQAKAAVEEHQRLQEEIFPNLKLGLLHGRMKSSEKEQVMLSFYQGDIDVLVATSVIEVGIDVPNATVMLIEGANRFGLAQLHQFRGRVGRGEYKSYCLLLSDEVTGDAEERLTAMEKTNDGFILAEKDLSIRGPGEFFGRRQSGLPELKMASLMDVEMLEIARDEAQILFEADPDLEQPEHTLLHANVERFWKSTGEVS
ncbi:MAG: ATP-dependent DNA helicase RecG [Candidatus Promineifilaceae bacterium]